MVKYFEKLENIKELSIPLIPLLEERTIKIDIQKLPLDFYIKYENLFKRIQEIDVLYKRKLGEIKFWKNEDFKECVIHMKVFIFPWGWILEMLISKR